MVRKAKNRQMGLTSSPEGRGPARSPGREKATCGAEGSRGNECDSPPFEAKKGVVMMNLLAAMSGEAEEEERAPSRAGNMAPSAYSGRRERERDVFIRINS